MNWTTREAIEGLKCIVETNTGCVFPAQVINGVWWNTEKAFPIDGVRRWIPYPEGGNPNDEIPMTKSQLKFYLNIFIATLRR